MNSIAHYLTHDHRRCDDFYIDAENDVSNENWQQAGECLKQFKTGMEHHFEMEEQVLFPSFEKNTGSIEGPTATMRSEHRQILALIEMLVRSLTLRDKDAYLGHSETLNIMMQQHNLKEEHILYPMSDQIMGKTKGQVLDAMYKISMGETR